MLLLSRKGSILVLLGFGLLLGLLGPANAIKCYVCSETTNDESKCLVEKPCDEGFTNCLNGKGRNEDGTDVIIRGCGGPGKGRDKCPTFKKDETQSCICYKDLCNNFQLTLTEEYKFSKKGGGSGVSVTTTASPVLALGAFLMVYLPLQQGPLY